MLRFYRIAAKNTGRNTGRKYRQIPAKNRLTVFISNNFRRFYSGSRKYRQQDFDGFKYLILLLKNTDGYRLSKEREKYLTVFSLFRTLRPERFCS